MPNERERARALQLRALVASQSAEPVDIQPNPDGTYGQPPEDMVFDPNRGVYTNREMIAANMEPSQARAATVGGMHGLSFRGVDEMAGGVGGEFERERTRAALDASYRDHPITTGASEAAGGGITAFSYGLPALAKRGLLGASAAGGAIGGAEGSVYGFLSGEGSFNERMRNVLPHTIMGAGAGAAAPFAIRGIDQATRPVRNAIGTITDRLLQRGSRTRAGRALSSTLDRAGMTPDDVDVILRQATSEGQPEFRAMDALGPAGQRRASGIVRSGDDAATEIAEFLNQRQVGQHERLAGFVEDAFGATDTASARQAALRASRQQAADTAYDAARQGAGPVDVRNALDLIDQRLAPMQGSGVAGDGVDTTLARFRSRLAAGSDNLPDGVSAIELSDFDRVLGVKQDIQDAASAAYRAGRNNEGRLLDRLWRSLDDSLEAASDGYRAANDGFREASRVIDSVEVGQRAARPGQRAADTVETVSRMTPDQQDAARLGYGDSILRRMESTAGEGTNRARPLTSPKFQEEAATLANDADLLGRRVARENTMFETRNRALGGSRTADNLADISDLQGFDASTITNLLTGRWGAAAGQISGAMSDFFTGMDPSTRRIIADALMSQDADGLRAAARSQNLSQTKRTAIENIARILQMQNPPDALGMSGN